MIENEATAHRDVVVRPVPAAEWRSPPPACPDSGAVRDPAPERPHDPSSIADPYFNF